MENKNCQSCQSVHDDSHGCGSKSSKTGNNNCSHACCESDPAKVEQGKCFHACCQK